MGRWDELDSSTTRSPLNDGVGRPSSGASTVGAFLRSVDEGANSAYLKCIYRGVADSNTERVLLCEKNPGCCAFDCCPKDHLWMAGVYVLMGFVLVLLAVAALAVVVCYQRSKSRQKKQERLAYSAYGGSQVDSAYPPATTYPTYASPVYTTYPADSYAPSYRY